MSSNWSSCPFCFQQVLSVDLQRHANDHFEDEPAQHIPVMQSEMYQTTIDDKFRCLVRSQVKDPRFKVKSELINLLNNCLEGDIGISILSGYVDHFASLAFEDVGWGCGWRNIQMLTSHLLYQTQEERNVLFGGCRFVPDIPSLQKWLEIAWDKGFDTPGSNHFDHKIYKKRAWIGTTECAALFRSFGLRARIVDFVSASTSDGKRRVTGPMDRYMKRSDADAGPSNGEKCTQTFNGHQVLVNWVWSYFCDNNRVDKSGPKQVVVTQKSPLYFQHDGHSRTIVGIQLKKLPNGTQQHNLLILDPAHTTEVLESCLRKKVGWQRYIKRGVHTLKKTEYQLCFMDPGIATGAEMEKLKTLDSIRVEF
ncbi:uncharacterized protein [Rutidosis leptorrhynchoides]|uniref:uncharacterized protein n=1 Tax=Rutidosis leptorrhynchoides TaxID=125765 RepID=UPI003A99CB66